MQERGLGPSWHALSIREALQMAASDGRGLSSEEAAAKLLSSGPNLLCSQPRWTGLRLALGQFGSPLTGILLLAAVLAFALRDLADGCVILGIVSLNATFGFLLEYRASNAVRRLASLHPTGASVCRDGARRVVPACDIVPGDVLMLDPGDAVPADARLLECFGLQCAEAVLTGESAPVEKDASHGVPLDAPLAERVTMVYAGTVVTVGRARALVVSTGMATEVGQIAHLLESTQGERSEGLREIGRLSRFLLVGAGLMVPVMLGVGWFRGQGGFSEALWMGVSLAVAALPEGLQTVLMIALSIGAHRLAGQHAVIRRLGALETLGRVNVVCADKTGTLTEGRMSVAALVTAGGDLSKTFQPRGEEGPSVVASQVHGGEGALLEEPVLPALSDRARRQVSKALAGACTGETLLEGDHARWSVDPTECALLAAARSILPEAARNQPLVLGWIQREIPFDASRRRRTNLRRTEDGRASVYVTGAPEEVISKCSHEWIPEGGRVMDPRRRVWWSKQNKALAEGSLRVLAFAYKPFEGAVEVDAEILEANLILVGLIGLRDMVRPDAAAALQRAVALGVRVVMLTGDQPQTAVAIARELGFDGAKGGVVSGTDLAGWSPGKLAEKLATTGLYARVTPGDKLRVVEALKTRGGVVAMVGDGVNDAPALQAADVGVAMGRGGAHVTKEAGDLVLLDDRLGTLMEAIAQGRRVRSSVARSIEYLLTGNAGEVLLIGGGMVAVGVTVLSPLQLLWINLVTDGVPALLLALPQGETGSVRENREVPPETLTNRMLWIRVAVFGCCVAAFGGLAYMRGGSIGGGATAKAYAFGAVVFEELLRSVVMGIEVHCMEGGRAGTMWALMATMVAGCMVQYMLLRVEWAAHILGGSVLTGAQIGEAFLIGGAAVLFGRIVLALGLFVRGARA